MLGNVRKALHGTDRELMKKHIGRNLGTFSYRFNRRFLLRSMIERLAILDSVLYLAGHAVNE